MIGGPSLVRDTGDDNAYSRAERDPEFLEAVRDAYAGRRDAVNALWWMSHPADAAPDGTPSPLDQLRDLQRRVFSADGGSLGDADATSAIHELEAELSAEREAIRDAVDAADRGHGRPGLESLFPVDRPVGAEVFGGEAGPVGASPAPEPPDGPAGRGHLLVVVGLVAAMVGGIVIGAQWSAGRVIASPSATPSATPAPSVTAEETCGQMSDVATVLMNAGSARAENRWTEQEWQGALALASRLLDRVDTEDGTELSRRIDELKILFPAGSSTTPFEVSDESSAAFDNVSRACDDAGSAIGVAAWTGG